MYNSTIPDPQDMCTTATTSTAPTTTSTAPTTTTAAPTTTTAAPTTTTTTAAATTSSFAYTTTEDSVIAPGYIPFEFYIDYKNPNQLLLRIYDYDYDSSSPYLLAAFDIECKVFRVFAPWTSRFRMLIVNWTQEKFSGNIYFMMRYSVYVRLGYFDYDSEEWILFPICGSREGPLGSFSCNTYDDFVLAFASMDILLITKDSYGPILMVNTTSNNTVQSNINAHAHKTFLAFGDAVYTVSNDKIIKWHGLYPHIKVFLSYQLWELLKS